MNGTRKHIVLCNGAFLPKRLKRKNDKLIELYHEGKNRNINIELPSFIEKQLYLKDRLKDLLEISSCVFLADRKITRGTTNDLEFKSWSRNFHFVVKVRDFDFWNNETVKESLSNALCFMTGDNEYSFTFEAGRNTFPTNLFDNDNYEATASVPTRVILFSGGLDSFTGVIEVLEKTNDTICLVSHNSGNPTTINTQKNIYNIIKELYPKRTKHIKFKCNMTGGRAPDETQRTRSFLYSSIAYAISSNLGVDELYFYENGITSLNFPKRADMINARSSRTTHPKTIKLLSDFYTLMNDSQTFTVQHPYIFKTKSDVISILKELQKAYLVNNTVSCSKVFKTSENHTHCGTCSQCVDRRFAMYFSEMDVDDGNGIYAINFILDSIENGGDRTTIIDYVRQALQFKKYSPGGFYYALADQLVDVLDYIEESQEDVFNNLYELCKRHGDQISESASKMRLKHDDISYNVEKNSFLDIMNERSFLKPSVNLLVEEICKKLGKAVPISFQKNQPKNENDLNDKINGIIASEKIEYEREFPSISFALAKTIPDHATSINGTNLLIETKYIRNSTTPSVINDGISSDLIKYPSECHKLFVIYDPYRQISDDKRFKNDFESKSNCTIFIVR